jgi:hypothetical protein
MVGPAGSEAALGFGHVEPVVAGRIELNLLGGDPQVRSGAFRVGQSLAKLVKRLAQIVVGRGRRPVRPEQVDEGFAAVGAVGLNGQEGQQGPNLIGGKGGQGSIIQRYPERTEQGNDQT